MTSTYDGTPRPSDQKPDQKGDDDAASCGPGDAAPGPDMAGIVAALREQDGELAELVERWPALPAAVRAGIAAMVRASVR